MKQIVPVGARTVAHAFRCPGPSRRLGGASHTGRQARIRLPLFALAFAIDAEGTLATADPAQDCAAEIALSPDVLLALAVGSRDALKRAEVTGDGTLAADLLAALEAFDWALALRPVLGDVLAARAAQAVEVYGGWRGRALDAVGRSLAEYATYEAELLADG